MVCFLRNNPVMGRNSFHTGFSALLFATASGANEPFGLAEVEAMARELSRSPYVEPQGNEALPKPLTELTYDQYRAIKNRPEERLWGDEGLPFRIELLHPGYLFKRAVKMHEVSPDGLQVTPIGYDPAHFDSSELVLDEEIDWASLPGYAGFRLQHPLNGGPEQWDEIASFAGASYFRVLGQDQRYGISARGLALNVAHPEALEEFPDFIAYWLVRPRPDDRMLVAYALLDSPSVAGAYRFRIVPGVTTEVDVEAALFFRREVKSVGLAPLTSMFFYGENSRERHFPDWRPEIHDSDGLLVESSSGELLWRPLVNLPVLRYSQFKGNSPRGFGLMQRDRQFRNYQDLDNPYHLTPSYWVEARGDWGPGAVRLVEIPTRYETFDNVVAFFEPENHPPVAGEETLRISYILNSKMHLEEGLSPERATATRVGVDPTHDDTRRFVIDFDGPTLRSLDRASQVFAVIDSGPNGYVSENRCFKNEQTGGWRVAFKLDTDDHNREPVELRCFLKLLPESRTLTETWSYQWHPEK